MGSANDAICRTDLPNRATDPPVARYAATGAMMSRAWNVRLTSRNQYRRFVRWRIVTRFARWTLSVNNPLSGPMK